MKHFKNGFVGNWKTIDAGAVIMFPAHKPTNVKFQVMSNSPIEIWVSENEKMGDAVLQAVADDKVSVEFVITSNAWVQIKAEKKASVFVNIRDVDQTVVTNAESYTNIEPRVRDNSEFARMMQWVKLNEERRNAALATEQEELRQLKAQLAEQAAKNEQQPKEADEVVEDVPEAPETTE